MAHMEVMRMLCNCQKTCLALDLADIDQCLDSWLVHFDRAEDVRDDTNMNTMHAVGTVLCIALQDVEELNMTHDAWKELMDTEQQSLIISDTPVTEMGWQDLSDVVTSLHMAFDKLFVFDPAAGFHFKFDIKLALLVVMRRLGYWLQIEWQDADTDAVSEDTPATVEIDITELKGIVERTQDNWCRIRSDTIVSVLDLVHALLSATRMLMQAKLVTESTGSVLELYNHHREASIDDFYEMTMISDIPFGAITQYKHRFRFLFHSPSQVIFFHYPSYQRHKQPKLEHINTPQASGLEVVPLLLQINPDIKVLYEHTGLGYAKKHAECWHWVVVAGHVLLVNTAMEAYCAQDARLLLSQVA